MTAPVEKLRRYLAAPPRSAEIVVWILLAFAVFGIRAYLIHLVPTVLWSRDAGSYVTSAFQWMHTGVWESDPRRGPVYSLLVAACLKLWGNLDALMVVQHILGGLAVFLALIVLRLLHTRRVIFVAGLCGWAFAVYAQPLLLEHLVRNETLLFFFATLIFVSWFLAVDRAQPHWLWITGLSAGLMQLTKGVFAPFPLVLIALHVWFYRKEPKLAAKQIVIFVFAFIVPLAANRVFHQATSHKRPPEPQSGILLYGRTAQFTVLDDGIEPEAKALIRQDVLDYRALPKLNNNIVLKITIVPKLSAYCHKLGKTPTDLNKLCQRLALEGIAAHKAAWAKQILHDLSQLNFKCGRPSQAPTVQDLASTERALKGNSHPDVYVHADTALATVSARLDKNRFAFYRHRVKEAWLFKVSPVLLTTLLLPVCIYFTTGKRRLWWLGCAAMWYFTLVLLSTVGRPLDRYLLPVVPVMFWTLSSAVIWLYCFALKKFLNPPLASR